MALKPWTMSFKETNADEVKLHDILSKKTSPMAFAKDVLIEVLVRKKELEMQLNQVDIDKKIDKDELTNIFELE